jgi:hypothetical protein
MALTYSADARNDILDGLVDNLDDGATNSSARMWIQTAGGTTLATLELSDPAFPAASAGAVAASGLPITATVSTSGTAAKFVAVDKDEDTVIQGSVGVAGSGADALIDSTALSAGGFVELTAFSMTAPGAT